MKKWCFFLGVLACAEILVAQDVALVKSNAPASVIVISDNAKGSCVPDALNLLNSGLKEIAGTALLVTKVSSANLKKLQEDYKDKPVVLLGKSAWTDDLQLKCPDQKADALLIQTFPNILVLLGNDDCYPNRTNFTAPASKGSYHAVVRFLESQGMRVFGDYPGGRIVEKKTDVVVKATKYSEAPYFPYRGVGNPYTRQMHQVWAGYGGSIDLWTTKHTFEMWRNWGKLFAKSHPEYFCMNKSNCLSNELYMIAFPHEGVVDEITKEAREYFSSEPMPGLRYFTVLQNDYCQEICSCEKCQEQVDYSGDPRGWFSDYVANAAVKAANAIAQDLPDAKIVQSAYEHYGLPPQKIEKYPSNLIVAISQHRSGLVDVKSVDEAMKLVDDWQKKRPGGVAFQRYYNTFADSVVPCFFPHAAVANIKAMKDADGKYGVPVLGEMHYGGNSGNKWWYCLMEYITARTLWNPGLDVDTLLDDFCQASFGPAAKPMRKYLALLEDFHVKNPKRTSYASAELKQFQECIDEACGVPAPEPFSARVKYIADDFQKMKKTISGRQIENRTEKAVQDSQETLKPQIKYDFDFELSTIINDTSGNEHHAILVAAKRIKTGAEDKALEFDGQHSYVKLREAYRLGETYSLEACIMPYPMNEKKQILGELDASYQAYHIFGSPSKCHVLDQVSISLKGGKCVFYEQANAYIASELVLKPQQWYHLVATRRGDGSMNLYINGKLSAFSEPKKATEPKRPLLSLIGASGGISSRYGDTIADCRGFFNGIIDNVRIYDTELSSRQIQYNYEQSAAALKK